MIELTTKLDMAGLTCRFFHHSHEPSEIWRDVPGYNGDYRASSLGGIWSRRKHKGKSGYLRPCLGAHGYALVEIDDRTEYAHRVVASAFHGSIPAGMHVCHYDGDKTNNRAGNLRIDTPAGNAFDSLFHRDRDRVFTTELYDLLHVGLFDRETDELVHCFGPIMSVIAERKVMGDDDLVRKAQIGIDRWKARKAGSQG